MALKTVKPTGRTAWPRILLDGEEMTGKSWSVAELSGSAKVGRTIVLPLGEDTSMWHEYGSIPGARFEIAEHDGTWREIVDIAKDVRDEAKAAVAAGDPPLVFAIDTITAVWEGLKDWTGHRARFSRAGKKALEADPDAKVDVPPNYWNDANDRHAELLSVLMTTPGIVIMVARGGEVMLYENGQPAKNGKTTWSTQVQKRVPFAATAHVRLSKDAHPLLVSKKGVHDPVRPGIDPPRRLPDNWTLESVIFGMLGLDAGQAQVGGFAEMRQDLTPEQIRDEALADGTTAGRLRDLYRLAKECRYDSVTVATEQGAEEPLLVFLGRIGSAKTRAGQPAAPPAKDKPSEHAWVSDFRVRLAETPTLEGIARRKNEVHEARESGISQELADMLLQEIGDRQKEISDAADQAAVEEYAQEAGTDGQQEGAAADLAEAGATA